MRTIYACIINFYMSNEQGAAKFFVSIRESGEVVELKDLKAQTEPTAKAEARKLQRYMAPERRINLFEQLASHQRYVGALIGGAVEWSRP